MSHNDHVHRHHDELALRKGADLCRTYLYHAEGSIDGDFDDGVVSRMSLISRMTQTEKLWLAEKCTRGTEEGLAHVSADRTRCPQGRS